jgi:hypothetical protein
MQMGNIWAAGIKAVSEDIPAPALGKWKWFVRRIMPENQQKEQLHDKFQFVGGTWTQTKR